MSQHAIWLTEQEVTSLVSLDETITALEGNLKALAEKTAFNVPKALAGFDDGSSMHSLGSASPAAGYLGYKNWVHTKRGAKAMYVLFDSHRGQLLAMMEANSLGQLRTAAMTGVGTKWMAPAGASELAIIGTGMQSLAQVASIDLVRPLERIRVWSPTADKRAAFADTLRSRFKADVAVAATLEEALGGTPLVTLVTRAKDPFVRASMLAPGAHLNAVGAILPANAEFHQDVFDQADFIGVDDVVGVQKASREFIDRFGPADADWSSVIPLGRIISGQHQRPANARLTLFKAMGMGLSDLSVAVLAYQRAIDRGIGQGLPVTAGAAPLRWRSSAAA